MADNAAWLLEGGGARSKMVLWAHNAHVARDPQGIFDADVVSMGMHLARTFGDDLVVTGFAFDRGEFRAVAVQGDSRPIRGVEVGAAPRGSLDAALASTGPPAFLLNLRPADRDTAAWLRQPMVTREVGALFFDEEDMCQTVVPGAGPNPR
jgi:erythromycin esterase